MLSRTTTETLTKTPFLLVVVLLFSFSLVSAEFNDTILWYDFNYVGNLTIMDVSNHSIHATAQNFDVFSSADLISGFSGNTQESTNNWVYRSDNTTPFDTLSLWFYIPDSAISTSYSLYHIKDDLRLCAGHAASIANPDNTSLYVFLRTGTSGSASCTDATTRIVRAHTPLPTQEWVHLVVYAGGGVYINNVQATTSTYVGSGGAAYLTDSNDIRIGEIAGSYNISGAASSSDIFIDEFALFNRSLLASERALLYNNGAGYSPYDTSPPYQTASIATISLSYNDIDTRDMTDYFNSATDYLVNFTYKAAAHQVDTNGTTYYGTDFTMSFVNSTTLKIWSQAATVINLPLTITASNAYGSVSANTYLTISGYDNPTQWASISNLVLVGSEEKSRVFGDYFTGYTRRFIQYNDPDTGAHINVDYTAPRGNSCFGVKIVGDTAYFQGRNKDNCNVVINMTVDDESSAAYGNFTLTTEVLNAQATGGAGLNYIENSLNFFPDASSLSTRGKLLYVIVTLVIFIAAFATIASKSQIGGFFATGVSLVFLITIIFYTSLGYIPIWMTVMLFLVAIIVAVGFFRRTVFGGTA